MSSDMQLNGYAYRDITLSKDADGLLRGDDYSVYVPIDEGEFHLNFADGTKSVFSPLQFHFHAPSEHSVDGKLYDLEVHFVHLYKESKDLGAVIGIFFDKEEGGDYESEFLNNLWDGGDEVVIQVESFLRNVDFSEYWNYPGSLTTPPCTEGIKWTVIKDV